MGLPLRPLGTGYPRVPVLRLSFLVSSCQCQQGSGIQDDVDKKRHEQEMEVLCVCGFVLNCILTGTRHGDSNADPVAFLLSRIHHLNWATKTRPPLV